jgi:hypothetical protein
MSSTQICPPEDRTSRFDLERNSKRARSAHANVRGSTQKFYEWLDDSAAGKLLPLGPRCGFAVTVTLAILARLLTRKAGSRSRSVTSTRPLSEIQPTFAWHYHGSDDGARWMDMSAR